MTNPEISRRNFLAGLAAVSVSGVALSACGGGDDTAEAEGALVDPDT